MTLRERLPSSLRPAEAVLWLREDARPVALVGEWAGVSAVLTSEPARTSPGGSGELSPLRTPNSQDPCAGDPFARLTDLEGPEEADAGVRVGGGWFGWLGYPLGGLVEALPPPPPAGAALDACSLAWHDHVVVLDEEGWWFEALVTPERESFLHSRLGLWRERLASPPPPPAPASAGPFAPVAPGGAGHEWAVSDAVRRIAEGELFQANLCLRMEGALDGSLLDLYSRALGGATPRFGALIGDEVLSLSPERFLRRTGRRVESDPVKGTAAERSTLRASAKDAAEHVMIVDLVRNDLGRVCEYGSVEAHEPRVEAHANVFHLVSTVSGTMREDATDADLLRATFPPGSVTGAPKVQAMKTISWLEASARGVYTGAIGYVSPVAGLELSVAIRTFEARDGRIWLGAGGGIVADSIPEAELAEALTKAAGPIAAIGATLHTEVGDISVAMRRKCRPPGLPAGLDHGPRPDPRRGLLETILAIDGEPQHLQEHLHRLSLSLGALSLPALPPDAEALIEQAAKTIPTGRARIRVEATNEGVTARAERATPRDDPPLAPFLLPGGLGPHKWLDRRLVDALAALGGTPLLVDADGFVLEAGAANVWIEEAGGLVTPPADGRILPGVTRARLIAEHAAREEPVLLDRLAAADAVLLSSAISGLRPVVYSPSSARYSSR